MHPRGICRRGKMSELTLKSGGILERSTWNTETQSYDIVEVSDHAYAYLNDTVTFDNIILKDLFAVIGKNLEVISPIFGNWIEENTKAALTLSPTEGKEKHPNDNIDFLEIYWVISADDDDGLNFPSWPSFHGIGTADEDDNYYKAGDTIKWGVDFMPVQDLVNLPLKIKDKASLCVVTGTGKNTKVVNTEYKSGSITLYQVIQAVVWEISWWGGPEGKSDRLEKLFNGEND